MAYPPMSEEHKAVLKRVAKTPGGSWRVIAENYAAETGRKMSKSTAHSLCETYGIERTPPPKKIKKNPPPVNKGDSITRANVVSEDDFEIDATEKRVVFRAKGSRFASFEAVLEYGKKLDERDWGQWKVTGKKMNSWDVTMKMRAGTGEFNEKTGIELEKLEAQTFTNYQIAVTLQPKKITEMALDEFVETLTCRPLPVIKAPAIHGRAKNKLCLVIGITDHHFGLYCWAAETGTAYDLDIAHKLYVDAFAQLLDIAERWGDVVEVHFPIGSDLFHINDPSNMTPAHGHVLDVDSRLAKVIDTAQDALVQSIEYAASKVPFVRGFWVPGNHDPESSYWMSRIIRERFRNTKHVEIDTSPRRRKFIKFGKCGLMFTHGDREAPRDLPTVMFSEERKLCGDSDYLEILTGHKHKEEVRVWTSESTHGMFTVRTLPSLMSRDAYHYEKGYIGTPRSAVGLIYDGEYGYRGSYPVFSDHLVDHETLTAI